MAFYLLANPTAVSTQISEFQDLTIYEGANRHLAGDNSTWEYTKNPAVCFHDMVTNFTGWEILSGGVVDLANYNDELISGVPRREIGLTLAKVNTVDAWVRGFRTYMGAMITWEAGKIRVIPNRADVEAQGAVVLDGTASTFVDVGDQAVLDFGAADDFTVECAFKATSDGAIVCKKALLGGNSDGYSIYLSSGDIFCRISDGSNTASDSVTGTFSDDAWHHVAMTINQTSNEMILIVDGVAETPVSISGVTGSLATSQEFRIGANGGGTERLTGLVDEVRVWDDTRTPTEVTDNMDTEITGDSVDYPQLIGYWRCNEDTSAGTAVDSSSSGNDGTLSGAAVFGFGNPQITPVGVVKHITVDDIVKDSFRLRRRSLRSVPNSVAVDYRDSSGSRWLTTRVQADSPKVVSGDETRRLSRVSLPGIHNASQAARESIERLNWYLTDLEATVGLFDEGWELQNGSIVSVTHPIGLDGKLFRVRGVTAKSGRWVIDLSEYDPAIYSNEVVSDPTIPDTTLGDPLNPPTVTGLTLAEELFTYKSGITGSRVRITFNGVVYPFLSQYRIEAYAGGVLVWQTTTLLTEVVTPGVEELISEAPVDYEVRVYTQSPFATSAAAIDNVDILGKLAVPGDVPGITATQTGAGTVQVTWQDAVDIDIWRYELRQGTSSDTWETATTTDIMDDTDRVVVGLALGQHRWFVKAIDSVKNRSTNAAFTDITLTAPPAVVSVSGFEVASEVRLNWPAQASGFVERYRIAYSDIPETFETTLDVVDTLRFQTKDVPEGTFTFKVYAQDAQGNESATAATIDIEVTSDADAFLADSYTFSSPTLTRMVEFDLRLDNRKLYVTHMGDVFSSISPSDFEDHDAEPLANYHSNNSSEWLSESHDFGLSLTGSWNLTHDVEALNGVVDVSLEVTNEVTPSTWLSFGTATKGEFRHARVRISTDASPGSATAFVKSPKMDLRINVVPLEESGEDTASATVGTVINLSREYSAVKEVNVQPKNKTDALMAVVDNIIVGQNTGVQTDTTNYLDGGDLANLDFGSTQDFSLEFWMKHTGGTQAVNRVLSKRNGSAAGWEVNFAETSENVSLTIDDGTNEVTVSLTDACPNDGDWHHIAFTVDRTGDLVRGYVDSVEDTGSGSPFSISTVTGSLDAGANPFRVFTESGGTTNHWDNGMIDELRIWDDIRTAGEISTNYLSELDVTQTQANLIHYWQMNGAASSNVTTVADRAAGVTADLTDTGAGDAVYLDSNTIQRINSFDVYVFDIFGQQLAEDFQWNWKAV
jgi:hypothetical protein